MKKKKKWGLIVIVVIAVCIIGAIGGEKTPESQTQKTIVNPTKADVDLVQQQPENNEKSQDVTLENKEDITEGSKQEQPKQKEEISPELVAFLESYEDFMDEYCEFMKNYNASDMSQLAKYTSLLSKYTEFAQKAEAWDAKEMNDAETLYYAEVMNRISIKLLATSQKMN